VTLGASWVRQVTQRHPATSTTTQQPAAVLAETSPRVLPYRL